MLVVRGSDACSDPLSVNSLKSAVIAHTVLGAHRSRGVPTETVHDESGSRNFGKTLAAKGQKILRVGAAVVAIIH